MGGRDSLKPQDSAFIILQVHLRQILGLNISHMRGKGPSGETGTSISLRLLDNWTHLTYSLATLHMQSSVISGTSYDNTGQSGLCDNHMPTASK